MLCNHQSFVSFKMFNIDCSQVVAGSTTGGSLISGATPKPRCFNCGILCNVTHATPKGQMCGTCHQYYQRTGHVRPTTAPARRDGAKSGLKYNQVCGHQGSIKYQYFRRAKIELSLLITSPVFLGDEK